MNILKKNDYIIAISAFLLGLITHGYMFFNGIFSHDATRIFQGDSNYQISLGRYIQPLYFNIRGKLQAPLLIGVLSLLFLIVGLIFINRVFNFKKTSSLILLSGLFVANITYILGCASYLPWVDIYMFCFMLCSISFYLICKEKILYSVTSCLLILIVLGMYQPYFAVIVGLIVIYCIKKIIDNEPFKKIMSFGLKTILYLLISLFLYYLILRLVLSIKELNLASSYNGIATVGDYSGVSIIKLLIETFLYPIKTIIKPNTFNSSILMILNIIMILLSAINMLMIVKNKKIKNKELVLLCVLILLVPLAVNVIYFISKGIIHELVIYSFNLLFVLVIIAQEEINNKIIEKVLLIILSLNIFSNVVYANQIYLKKDLEYEATKSLCTRIIDRVEQLDGYCVGITPVTFVGDIRKSPLVYEKYGYDQIKGMGITDQGSFSITYDLTAQWFFNEIMGMNINYVESNEYSDLKEVKDMPVFPEKGSIKIINGTVVIKISD